MPEANNIDLERCVTPSIQQGTACPPSLSSKAGRHCAIAVQHLDGRAVLINATIKEDDGDLVLSSARKQVSRALTRSWHQKVVGKLLMGLVVGTARVKQVRQVFSGGSFDFSPLAHISSQRSHTADHDHAPQDIKDHRYCHLESTSKISPLTPYSQKHSTPLTSSSARQLTL